MSVNTKKLAEIGKAYLELVDKIKQRQDANAIDNISTELDFLSYIGRGNKVVNRKSLATRLSRIKNGQFEGKILPPLHQKILKHADDLKVDLEKLYLEHTFLYDKVYGAQYVAQNFASPSLRWISKQFQSSGISSIPLLNHNRSIEIYKLQSQDEKLFLPLFGIVFYLTVLDKKIIDLDYVPTDEFSLITSYVESRYPSLRKYFINLDLRKPIFVERILAEKISDSIQKDKSTLEVINSIMITEDVDNSEFFESPVTWSYRLLHKKIIIDIEFCLENPISLEFI